MKIEKEKKGKIYNTLKYTESHLNLSEMQIRCNYI